ncbi:MAG: tRNA (guanosine(46)-N7)-methyltransferase TrmB, partial [Betaproteobacteria bacterium]|nr:tRNA (guanosine(46)-N7)-methyltransferase TrmB [Betaproteobacteria bacterium]
LTTRLVARAWPEGVVEPRRVTGRHAPLSLEIGAGDGENVVALAAARPDEDFIACEVHGPGVGHLLLRAEALQLTNLWVARRDVNDLLACLPDAALSTVYMFFPDPWPKLRHHKRRLFQAPLLTALARVVASHGHFWVATDSDDYAAWMREAAALAPDWRNLAGPGMTGPRLRRRVLTKFERRAVQEGRRVFDFGFARV